MSCLILKDLNAVVFSVAYEEISISINHSNTQPSRALEALASASFLSPSTKYISLPIKDLHSMVLRICNKHVPFFINRNIGGELEATTPDTLESPLEEENTLRHKHLNSMIFGVSDVDPATRFVYG